MKPAQPNTSFLKPSPAATDLEGLAQFKNTPFRSCAVYAHRQEIGAANMRSPKGTVCSAS
jgi:hypothetical protein